MKTNLEMPIGNRKSFLFDHKTIAAECPIDKTFNRAGQLKLSTVCKQLALDVAKVVAHLNPDPRVQAAIEATEKCLADPTAENRDAALAAWSPAASAAGRGYDMDVYHTGFTAAWAVKAAVVVGWAVMAAEAACETARNAAENHPELIHILDAREARFRTDVHNAEMVALGKIDEIVLALPEITPYICAMETVVIQPPPTPPSNEMKTFFQPSQKLRLNADKVDIVDIDLDTNHAYLEVHASTGPVYQVRATWDSDEMIRAYAGEGIYQPIIFDGCESRDRSPSETVAAIRELRDDKHFIRRFLESAKETTYEFVSENWETRAAHDKYWRDNGYTAAESDHAWNVNCSNALDICGWFNERNEVFSELDRLQKTVKQMAGTLAKMNVEDEPEQYFDLVGCLHADTQELSRCWEAIVDEFTIDPLPVS